MDDLSSQPGYNLKIKYIYIYICTGFGNALNI